MRIIHQGPQSVLYTFHICYMYVYTDLPNRLLRQMPDGMPPQLFLGSLSWCHT